MASASRSTAAASASPAGRDHNAIIVRARLGAPYRHARVRVLIFRRYFATLYWYHSCVRRRGRPGRCRPGSGGRVRSRRRCDGTHFEICTRMRTSPKNACNAASQSCRVLMRLQACCRANCTYAAAGTPCTSDGDLCTTDICSATGACLHVANNCTCGDGVVGTNEVAAGAWSRLE